MRPDGKVSSTRMVRRKKPTPTDALETPASRFFRHAERCRARDLSQLIVLSDLVRAASELIHALQKERGVGSIYLGSRGTRFAEELCSRVSDSERLEARVRERLEHIDEQLDRMSAGVRFYRRVAFAFGALDTLPRVRTQISTRSMASSEAVRAFNDIIAQLLAVGFEAADLASDPATSSALIALVSFAQGKEYAGQERATAAAAFSRGQFEAAEHERLRELQAAQRRAFQVFARFARAEYVAALEEMDGAIGNEDLKQLRAVAVGEAEPAATREELPATWFELTTRRIDAMKYIEDELATEVQRLCTETLRGAQGTAAAPCATRSVAPVAMLVAEVGPAEHDLGLTGGIGLYTLDDTLPKPMHSILSVLEAQARVIDDVSGQLRSARTALSERKLIERAKGVLMRARRLSEQSAYDLMRQTAMGQNKRMVEVAEAIIGMADLFKA